MKIVRTQLKSKVLVERSPLGFDKPVCPICKGSVVAGSLHEVILDRGDTTGVPFEIFVQIFVPWNVVIVHETGCHLAAQHTATGKELCIEQILEFYSPEVILEWMKFMCDYVTASTMQNAKHCLESVIRKK